MSHPLDENFFYNSMLAKALVQLLPPYGKLKLILLIIYLMLSVHVERKIMRSWFYKLLTLDKNIDEKEIRNEYMWFILLMLQCQKMREPFNSMPPPEISPLRDIVVCILYECTVSYIPSHYSQFV